MEIGFFSAQENREAKTKTIRKYFMRKMGWNENQAFFHGKAWTLLDYSTTGTSQLGPETAQYPFGACGLQVSDLSSHRHQFAACAETITVDPSKNATKPNAVKRDLIFKFFIKLI